MTLLALLFFVTLSATPVPVGAQAVCDPYSGCNTTTSTPPRPRPVIIIDIRVTAAGQVIRVRACGYLPGITLKVTINGIVVAQVVTTTNPPKNCNPNSFASSGGGSSGTPIFAVVGPLARALASSHRISAQTAPSNAYAEASVTVPALPPGNYLVCAEAPGFETPCTPLTVVSAGTSGGGGGPLAFTGFHIAELAAAGLAAIAVGRMLVRRNRRRTRRA